MKTAGKYIPLRSGNRCLLEPPSSGGKPPVLPTPASKPFINTRAQFLMVSRKFVIGKFSNNCPQKKKKHKIKENSFRQPFSPSEAMK